MMNKEFSSSYGNMHNNDVNYALKSSKSSELNM